MICNLSYYLLVAAARAKYFRAFCGYSVCPDSKIKLEMALGKNQTNFEPEWN